VATHGKWQRTEPANRDRPATLEAETVSAGIEPGDRVVDPDESGRAHFEQREFQCYVNIGMSVFDLIDDLGGSIGPAVANAVINVALQLCLLRAERFSQFRCPGASVLSHGLSPQGISPLNDPNEEDDDCNEQEHVNQSAERVGGGESQYPEQKQNDEQSSHRDISFANGRAVRAVCLFAIEQG